MIMTRALHLLTVSFAVLFCVSACSPAVEDGQSDLSAEVSSLVDAAARDLKNQDFDGAMEKALHALEISRNCEGGVSFG